MYQSAPLHLDTFYLLCRVVSHSHNGSATEVEGTPNSRLLSEETVVSVIGLAQTLRKIRARLLNEGLVIKNGKVVALKKEKV